MELSVSLGFCSFELRESAGSSPDAFQLDPMATATVVVSWIYTWSLYPQFAYGMTSLILIDHGMYFKLHWVSK